MKDAFVKLAAYAIVTTFCLQQNALAQRGLGSPSLSRDGGIESLLSGFTGFFDTNVVHKDELVGELPTFSLEYGLSENVTLGVNTLSALSLLASTPLFLGKMRYRFLNSNALSSSVTFYGAYVSALGSSHSSLLTDPGTSAFGVVGTSTTSFVPVENSVASVTIIGGAMKDSSRQERSILYASTTRSMILCALSYEYFFLDNFGIQATLANWLYQYERQVSSSNDLSTHTKFLGALKNPIARVAIDFRFFDNWLLSGYLYGSTTFLAPWVTLARRF